jgi:hypothetical protein
MAELAVIGQSLGNLACLGRQPQRVRWAQLSPGDAVSDLTCNTKHGL